MADIADLFDELCLRWVREADVVVQQSGTVVPTLVVLPRDVTAEEVAIRLDGLRGNLYERSVALVTELRPTVAPLGPAGLVFMSAMRLGTDDGVAVYVTLGAPDLRRALGFRIVPATATAFATLERAASDPPVADYAWLDELLSPPVRDVDHQP